jgi:hypothetical protein
LSDRLPAKLEVAALIRRTESEGGFASVLHRGDPDRGAISLLITQRGRAAALLERRMAADFTYRWSNVMDGGAISLLSADWVETKSHIDPDCWLVELDIADAERFIAETTALG